MRAAIHDIQMLRAIRPLDLMAYLRASGWRLSEESPKAAFWEKAAEAGRSFEVLAPRSSDFADFAARIGELLNTLEVAENRSQLEIFSDLVTANADVIRVRTHARDGEDDGSLSLEDGVMLYERVREMVLAAACATIRKSAVFTKRKPEKAMSYLRKVRLGQTERGSYVFTLISPVNPSLRITDSLFTITTEEPFERQVVETLANALSATRFAAERSTTSGDMRPFREAINSGVSANLFEAISGLSEGSGDQSVEVSFSWARSRTLVSQVPDRIGLSQDIIPVIREAARVFRATVPQEDFELQGVVVQLRREEGEQTGRIIIVGDVEERMRRVSVVLPSAQYHEAIRAHDEGIPVICYGELERDGRSFALNNPRDFALMSEDQIEHAPDSSN